MLLQVVLLSQPRPVPEVLPLIFVLSPLQLMATTRSQLLIQETLTTHRESQILSLWEFTT